MPAAAPRPKIRTSRREGPPRAATAGRACSRRGGSARNSTGNRGGILLVGHRLEPSDVHAIEGLLEGDVDHTGRRPCPVPVLLAGRDPHRIAGTNLADWAAPGLNPADAGQDMQRLDQRMRVPCGPRDRKSTRLNSSHMSISYAVF